MTPFRYLHLDDVSRRRIRLFETLPDAAVKRLPQLVRQFKIIPVTKRRPVAFVVAADAFAVVQYLIGLGLCDDRH